MMRILSIDIGGTHLKAAVVNSRGQLVADKVSMKTPAPCPPRVMLAALAKLVGPLPPHDRIAVGFPGVVRDGHVITAPNLGTRPWCNYPLTHQLTKQFGGLALLINDAEMQGLAVIKGKGLELVLTLGTGAGTGLFRDGEIMPHLELAHHPIHHNRTYDEYIGGAALKKVGRKRWNKRVKKIIPILHTLLNYDHLFIGGGNAQNLDFRLPRGVSRVSNIAGLEGAAALWRMEERAKTGGG